jgi:tRNA1(Val) A37 N6-methylase TrmN6
LEEVQPSLATKEIINAAVETIGENKKVTLIQKKNDQSSRVVVIINERTGEKKLVDESPIITTPPTQTTYTTTTEGKTKITTTDIEKFKKNDEQVDKVISKIE